MEVHLAGGYLPTDRGLFLHANCDGEMCAPRSADRVPQTAETRERKRQRTLFDWKTPAQHFQKRNGQTRHKKHCLGMQPWNIPRMSPKSQLRVERCESTESLTRRLSLLSAKRSPKREHAPQLCSRTGQPFREKRRRQGHCKGNEWTLRFPVRLSAPAGTPPHLAQSPGMWLCASLCLASVASPLFAPFPPMQ